MANIPDFIKKPAYDWVVEEDELSDFISEVYNRPYRIQQQGDMMNNDTFYEFDVDGSDNGVDGWPSVGQCERELRDWLDVDHTDKEVFRYDFQFMRECYVAPEIVLWNLCRKGVIPAGKYLMKVQW